MKFQPLYDKVVVKQDEAITKTKSGIYLPGDSIEKPAQGKVLAIGPGIYNENGILMPLTVAVDDEVLFGKSAGVGMKIDGEEVLILSENEIMGILHND